MPKVFLTAEWKNLLMANYQVDPDLLAPFLPGGTEPDTYNGHHYLSLVGFCFQDTRLMGFTIPGHRNFEEVNLRFYVRYKSSGIWRRGVVFIKEIVPRTMISFVANSVFGENYETFPMKHRYEEDGDFLKAGYEWKTSSGWNYLKAVAEAKGTPAPEGSEEEFITEHYWGFTCLNDKCSGMYHVAHPSWKVHRVLSYEVNCDAAGLYGADFGTVFRQKPASVFLAGGSAIQVMGRSRIYFETGALNLNKVDQE